MTTERPIVFVGPFAPPVNGQIVATTFLYEACQRAGLLLMRANIVRGNTRVKALNHLIRTGRVLRCVRLLFKAKLEGAKVFYLSVDANAGMFVTILLSALGSLLRYGIYLHHHTFTALAARQRRMVWLARVAGADAVHITICPAMNRSLQAAYPEIRRTATQSNAVLLDARCEAGGARPEGTPFRIGFISRLTAQKGALDAIEVFRRLRAEKLPVQLHLAGPRADETVWREVTALREECGPDEFLAPGMLEGRAKQDFYENIDVFLFPTRYPNETQGIVNLEAMANGVPVVAFGRCCVASDVGEEGGVVVPPEGDFAAAAVPFIRRLMDDPAEHASRRTRALDRFAALKTAAEGELQNLVASLNS